MSTLKTNSVQIGQSATAANNFVLTVPAVPDGSMKLARGNVGATTQDVLTMDAAGIATFPAGLSMSDKLDVTSITFPATQVPSANANTLDDYEEGTWTPILSNLTISGTPTYTGRYTKVGRQVTFSVSITSTGQTASTLGSTTMSIPFNSAFNSVCYAVNRSTVQSLGNGAIPAGNSIYLPGWTATVYEVVICGSYFVS